VFWKKLFGKADAKNTDSEPRFVDGLLKWTLDCPICGGSRSVTKTTWPGEVGETQKQCKKCGAWWTDHPNAYREWIIPLDGKKRRIELQGSTKGIVEDGVWRPVEFSRGA